MKKFLLVALLVTTLPACGRPDTLVVQGTSQASTALVQTLSSHAHEDDEAQPLANKEDLGHFFQVDSNLYRGQQPSDKGFEMLKAKGIKTVVNLRYTKSAIAHEKEVVEKLGMKYVSIPINCFKLVPQGQVDEWLKTVNDPANQPVFLHCKHGKDRTGSFTGIYRVETQDWKFSQAYKEMKEKGFRTFWLNLTYATYKFAKKNEKDAPAPAELKQAGLAY
jgi:protein tyrosine/serine phosphatase